MTPADQTKTDKDTETSVFFSYSRVNRAQAMPIIDFIEAAGFQVWWDGMLEGGTEFLKHTEAALERAKAVVVLWSSDSVGSHWVRDEATTGRERRRLIPLSLDGTMPPLGFRQIQAIDMRNWRENQSAQDQILKRLATLHDRPFETVIHPVKLSAASKTIRVSKRTLMLGGGAALLLGGAGVMFQRGQRRPLGDIAILPFENLLGDETLTYLADGLASSVRDGLSMNEALRVTARSSSREAMRTLPDAVSMAKTLRVESLLEGRLERLGREETVTISLIKGKSGLVDWTESFPFNPTRILQLRDAIIQKVVNALSPQLTPRPSTQTINPAAYDQYLRGKALLQSGATLERVERARDHFEQAVDLDPSFGLAHAALAEQYLLLGVVTSDKATSLRLIDQAYATAEAAVAVNPDSATTYAVLGHVRLSGRSDFKGAAEAYAIAQKLGLYLTEDIARYAIFQAGMGRTHDAIQAARKGVFRDPLDPGIQEVLAYATYASGDFEKAARLYRDVLDMDSDRYTVRAWLGLSEIYGGDAVAGLRVCSEEANKMERLTCQAIAYHRQGETDQANIAYKALIETYGDAAAYQQAQILAQAGDVDDAMETLRTAEQLQDTGLGLLYIDPAMTPLRSRDDFKALLARLGMNG